MWESLASVTAPKSSKPGMDCRLTEATRTLQVTNLTSTFPLGYSEQR